jgi:hypothetical protein
MLFTNVGAQDDSKVPVDIQRAGGAATTWKRFLGLPDQTSVD